MDVPDSPLPVLEWQRLALDRALADILLRIIASAVKFIESMVQQGQSQTLTPPATPQTYHRQSRDRPSTTLPRPFQGTPGSCTKFEFPV